MAWELNEAIRYYQTQGAPGDQNALTGLLREVQQENAPSPMVFRVEGRLTFFSPKHSKNIQG